MGNIQTILRKRSITPAQTGKMILEDFLQTRKTFLQDPTVREGCLDPVEKELLLARGRLSPNRRDMIIYLILRDFMHEMAFRQQLAKQSFDLSYARLSHMVELAKVAERMNLDRIGRKGKVSSSFFEEHRAETLLNGRNIIQGHIKAMMRSIATLAAFNTGLECICRVTGLESIRSEITPLSGMYYDIGELQSAVDDLLGSIVRDGREPAHTVFPDGVPVSPKDWMMALELCQEGQQVATEDLKKELRSILSVNVDLDQTAIKLYEKTFNLQKILKDGVADLEKLTNNILKTHEIGGQ